MLLIAAVLVTRIPVEWLAPAVAHLMLLLPAQQVELPTTTIGLIGLAFVSQTAVIGYLLKGQTEILTKYAEGTAATANGLEAIRVAIQQSRSEHELEKRLDKIIHKLEPPPPPSDWGRRGAE